MKFIPGEVTPEQLEEYRQQYETARLKSKHALYAYEAAYFTCSVTSYDSYVAESVYVWAQQGMVQEASE